LSEVTASARSLPSCTCGSTAVTLPKNMVMRPPSRSVMTGAAPR
jgi:hypothetical protein